MGQVLCGVDPGPTHSAYAIVATRGQVAHVSGAAYLPNDALLKGIGFDRDDTTRPQSMLVIEEMEARGMPLAQECLDTCVWAGRIIQAWGGPHTPIRRSEVKLRLCGSTRAKDSNVRRAVLDRFPATGGGKTPEIGTKKEPGPLFGIPRNTHVWAALGVVMAYLDRRAETHHQLARATTMN